MRLEWSRNWNFVLMVQLVAGGLLRSNLIIYLTLAWSSVTVLHATVLVGGSNGVLGSSACSTGFVSILLNF